MQVFPWIFIKYLVYFPPLHSDLAEMRHTSMETIVTIIENYEVWEEIEFKFLYPV